MSEPNPGTAVATRPQRQTIAVADAVPLFDTAQFEHMQRVAVMMAKATLVPQALRGSSPEEAVGNCFLVVNQARHWNMDPFAVAQCCSVVYGRLMYEGKLVSAVIRSILGIDLQYHFTGTKGSPDYRVYVSDEAFDEKTIALLAPGVSLPGRRIIDGSVGEWQTFEKNNVTPSPAWLKQPDMQLRYRGSRVWTRAYEPAVMLGVYTDDEMDEAWEKRSAARDVTIEASATPVIRPLASGFGDETDKTFAKAKPEEKTEEKTETAVEQVVETPAGEPETTEADPAATGDQVVDAEFEETETVTGEGEVISTEEATRREMQADADRAAAEEQVAAAQTGAVQVEQAKEEEKKEVSISEATDPFAAYSERVQSAGSPDALKQHLRSLAKTEAWSGAEPEAQRMARIEAWGKLMELRDEGQKGTDPASDCQIFRLFLEVVKDPEELMGTWSVLIRSEDYKKRSDAEKKALGELVVGVRTRIAPQ